MDALSLMKHTALALMQGQTRAAADPHRPLWHLAPSVGLLNDPNGFIQHNGVYHLFYQWNPLACDHGRKCWGHWQSRDLLHWQHQPVALLPDACYDSHGCYSGSAVGGGRQDHAGLYRQCEIPRRFAHRLPMSGAGG
ncbi:Sucrose-6-phosphate hydrolase [Serratia rubidaea]|uniref:Sucrose-6-phosphate hydrolase n=1 Tax=Serratia rubidaea TaxID=61652 RepID=A0A4U9HXC6_SERRU|nr:Sucrose-6-phosphate hydrolase [Serratia rubidaea]